MNDKMFRIAVVGGFHKEDVTNYIEETAKKTKAELEDKNAQIQSLTAQVGALQQELQTLQAQQQALQAQMQAQQEEFERRLAAQEKDAQDALTLCSIKGDEQCEDLRVSYEVRLAEMRQSAEETEAKLRADLLEQIAIATAQTKETTELHEQIETLAGTAREYEALKGNITQIELSAIKRARERESQSEETVRRLKGETEEYLAAAKERLKPLIQAAQAQANNAELALAQLKNVMDDLRAGALDVQERFGEITVALEPAENGETYSDAVHTIKVNSLHDLIERIRAGKTAEEIPTEKDDKQNG